MMSDTRPHADGTSPLGAEPTNGAEAADSMTDRPQTLWTPRVLWTRGTQCHTLAQVLSGGTAIQAEGDLTASCIRTGAGLLVTKHLTSFDRCSLAVPHGFTPATTRSVVAAVGSGPHSQLAAIVAHRLGLQLGVPARAIYGYRENFEHPPALEALHEIGVRVPGLAIETIQSPDPAAMVSSLPAGTLLVVGAPGGSWFQRQFFGPGARIQAKAPHGTIVVKHAPTRVCQVMRTPTAFGPHMRVAEAARLAGDQHLIVAQEGQLLGLVPNLALSKASPTHELQNIMDDPVFLAPEEDVESAADLMSHQRLSAIPVVDASNRIVGVVTAVDLATHPLLG